MNINNLPQHYNYGNTLANKTFTFSPIDGLPIAKKEMDRKSQQKPFCFPISLSPYCDNCCSGMAANRVELLARCCNHICNAYRHRWIKVIRTRWTEVFFD